MSAHPERSGLACVAALFLNGLFGASVAAQEPALPRLSDETAAQFPAIGRLGQAGFRTRQGCTATLIAPDLVLTAAHCVSETGQSGRVFVAGWSRGDYIASRGTARELRHPNYATDGTHHPRHDIALVLLDAPIPDVAPIPLAEPGMGLAMDQEVAIVGYHRQTPHLLSGSFTCPVTGIGTGLAILDCPVINGNSGAPVLARTAQGTWQIVGVVSSQRGAGAIAVTLPYWVSQQVATLGG